MRKKNLKRKTKIPVPRNYKLSLKRYIYCVLIKCTSRQFYKQDFLIPQGNNGGSHKRETANPLPESKKIFLEDYCMQA